MPGSFDFTDSPSLSVFGSKDFLALLLFPFSQLFSLNFLKRREGGMGGATHHLRIIEYEDMTMLQSLNEPSFGL